MIPKNATLGLPDLGLHLKEAVDSCSKGGKPAL